MAPSRREQCRCGLGRAGVGGRARGRLGTVAGVVAVRERNSRKSGVHSCSIESRVSGNSDHTAFPEDILEKGVLSSKKSAGEYTLLRVRGKEYMRVRA